MKYINYWYFNIYCWYYRMKENGRNVDPVGTTCFAFAMSIAGWAMFFIFTYFDFKRTSIPSNCTIAISVVMFIAWAIINEYYLTNNRYLEIFNQYSSGKKKIGLSIFLLVLPYLLIIVEEIVKGILK
jgi:hypothetical protein